MSTETKYFQSQVFIPGQEISAEEARSRGTYVALSLCCGVPSSAELITDGRITEVIYYGVSELSDEQYQEHCNKYGQALLTMVSAPPGKTEQPVRLIAHYDKHRALLGVEEEYMDDEGRVLKEMRYGGARDLIGSLEYQYSENGKLKKVVELAANGSIVDSFEP